MIGLDLIQSRCKCLDRSGSCAWCQDYYGKFNEECDRLRKTLGPDVDETKIQYLAGELVALRLVVAAFMLASADMKAHLGNSTDLLQTHCECGDADSCGTCAQIQSNRALLATIEADLRG